MKCTIIISVLFCYMLVACTKKDEVPGQQYIAARPVEGKNYSVNEIIAFKQLSINATGGKIVRLPRHVSVYLVDTAYPYMTREVDSIIAELNRLLDTNLVITRTLNKTGALIRVYLTDRDTYINAEPQAGPTLQNSTYTGLAYLNWNDSGIIDHCSTFADMTRTATDTLQQRYIIHHEMMHSLGLLGHVSLVEFYSTLFYYTTSPYILDYTLFDKKMMLLLYNPAIKAGMNEAEFNEVVVNL